MSMLRSKIRLLLVGSFLLVSPISAGAVVPDDTDSLSDTLTVENVLARESSGQPVDRAQLSKLGNATDFARWQAGMLQRGGSWVTIDQLAAEGERPIVREYLKRREAETLNVEGHRRLAKWCRENKLDMQATAHLSAILDLLPNDFEARRKLGYKFINGSWYSPDQLLKADEASEAYLKGLREWMPECQRIAKLLARDTEDKARGLKRLKEIDSPTAIPALEQMSVAVGDSVASPWIQAIAKWRTPSACMAMARIALTEPGERTKLAASKMSEYPREFYVPELLGLLATPIETRVRYGINDHGELMISRAMFRSTNQEKHVVEFDRLVRTNSPVQTRDITHGFFSIENRNRWETGRESTVPSKANSPANIGTDEIASAKSAVEDQALLEREIAQANAQSQAAANRVYSVLRQATGEQLEAAPEIWWEWWRKYNYRSLAEKSYKRQRYQQVDAAPLTLKESRYAGTTQFSCLVAGTTIQTGSGLRAIEQIRVGDLVLAQDVETAELALKPVVRTTLRDPESIFRIKTQHGDIRATGGHRWWISGNGWLMSAQLQPGMLMHNAQGTTKITAIEVEADPLPTHNLIVEGFHTYFVGSDHVLSFDNADPVPSLRKLPGY